MNYENMTRRRVLCFGDSNTYGYDPARDGRYGDDERYPMVLQDLLGDGWSVVEEGLPGRTAVFDDPITEGMNGLRVTVALTEEQAQQRAYEKIRQMQEIYLGEEGVLLSETVTYSLKDGVVYAFSECVCEENIAEAVPISSGT